ncbi:hypothetical protein ACGFXC_11630 [Streptomyces sp. NPDC048507]|uniref:hypothetical protein n=1 Tax=Streptomyces sp. NPDC048507 TaxID=3365560 RepID=UPI00371284DE
MDQLNRPLTDAERAELRDLADATGRPLGELAPDAVRELLRAERERVGRAAARLARAHAPLLDRLGR